MTSIEQMDLFVYLKDIEELEGAVPLSAAPVPALAPSILNRTPFSFWKWSRTALAFWWIVLHNLFGLACWVNVYTVTRGFGGPEEGGWYYLQYQCLKSRQVGFWEASALQMKWLQEYGPLRWGDLRFRSGGQDVVVLIERRKAASRTTFPPRFADYADRAIPYSLIQGI